jgi:hypothetical protein
MKGRVRGVYKSLYIIFTELVSDTGSDSVLGDSSPKQQEATAVQNGNGFVLFLS